MNGLSLLIAVAALGVDVGWEAGPGGQTYYTIHIEKLLLDPLREGQAIVSNVDPNDRNLSRFQILVGDHAHAISSQPGASGRDMVQHGWRPGENGGNDYLIQISPERLESLAKGSSIIGQIDPQVTDIRKLYVFSGVQQLPQQLATAAPQQPKFLGTGGGLRTASGESTADSPARVGAPQFNNAQFNGNQPAGPGRSGDFPAAGNPATGTNGANGGNQFDLRQPPQDDWRTSGQPNVNWNAGAAAQPGTDNRMLPVPQLPTGQPTGFAGQPNGYNGQTGYQGQPGYGPNPPYPQQTFAPAVPPSYGQPNPTTTAANNAAYQANLDLLLAQAKAQGAAEATKAAAANAPDPTPPVPANPATVETKEAEKPWVPLIMTALMLAVSFGTNLFLGWLAWSFFWRFRDAAGDATRAQTSLLPTRQAA